MSTPSERLEATVWIDSTFLDIPVGQREEFFAAADAYYDAHPVAARCPDTLGILHQDDRAFTEILRCVLGEDHPAFTASSSTKAT